MAYNTHMNQAQSKARMKAFIGNDVLTFTIKYSPGNKWVAQCNEVDGIITCGTGFDLAQMEDAIEDAILTAAGIPRKFTQGLLKRVWSGDVSVQPRTELDSASSAMLFQSTYKLNHHHAGVGQV